MDTPHDVLMGFMALTGMATILVATSIAAHNAIQRWYDRER